MKQEIEHNGKINNKNVVLEEFNIIYTSLIEFTDKKE